MSTVDITPSPRVLRMLGQIDFAPWQCLAELIDNSIDAFIDQSAAGAAAAAPRIYIKLPSEAQLRSGTGVISVKDNASGMPIESLKNAVKAGYSGNDPVDKMGLFGMGFNISTARMGRRTEVRTTRADDSEWTSVIIDFDELETNRTFHAPLETHKKTSEELENRVHGTEIRISRLDLERVRPLIWGAGKRNTKDRLGKIYGRVMTKLGINIYYDSDLITPRRHCAWDAMRTVETKTFGNVPARIEIDKTLAPQRFCTTCWVWLLDLDKVCSSCGNDHDVIERSRRLKGWLGVQRYFDKKHYGIDLIRNGRVIEELDKSFFTFTDENGDTIFEYPIDATHWGGRLIGELEIDFVRVSHQKDSFDKLDSEWKKVVELVRGKAPLQPLIAERMGLGKNDSPLSRLFTAYRKGTAGLKDLVPGTTDGTGLNSGLVKEYVDKFNEGDPEYQSDEKWYQLVLQAEAGKRGESKGAEEAGGDFPIDDEPEESGEPDKSGEDEQKAPEAAPNRPDALPELDDKLSGTYEVEELSGDVVLKVLAYKHKADIDGAPFRVKPDGYSFRFDYNPRSEFFENRLETPADYLVIDLAQHFLALSAESPREKPVSRVARSIREKYFARSSDDLSAAATAASSLLDEIRRHYDEMLPALAPIDPDKLPSRERDRVRRNATKSLGLNESEVEQFFKDGKFAGYVSQPFVVELVRTWPTLSTDGEFFNRPYSGSSDELRTMILDEIADALQDVVWLVDEGVSAVSKDTGWRLRYAKALSSLRLLQYWRV
jgi:hypothetical protein